MHWKCLFFVCLKKIKKKKIKFANKLYRILYNEFVSRTYIYIKIIKKHLDEMLEWLYEEKKV